MSEQATLGEVLLGVAGLAMLRQTSTGDVVDAARGSGRYSEFLVARGHKVIGVDQSPA